MVRGGLGACVLPISLSRARARVARSLTMEAAPSQTTRSAGAPRKWATMRSAVERAVMSPCSWMTPGMGAISCRSTATMIGEEEEDGAEREPEPSAAAADEEEEEGEEDGPHPAAPAPAPSAASASPLGTRVRASTCDQEPGAAQRSTTRSTGCPPVSLRKPYWASSCSSLKAERARKPTSFALR